MFLVSACLAGLNCRYNGSNCAHAQVQALVDKGKALPICPEQLAGLQTPREACEILTDSDGNRKVIGKNGRDYTQIYQTGAERTLTLCKAFKIKKAILKSGSPSCGSGKIYDGTFSCRLIDGDGITASRLKQHGILVENDKSL